MNAQICGWKLDNKWDIYIDPQYLPQKVEGTSFPVK